MLCLITIGIGAGGESKTRICRRYEYYIRKDGELMESSGDSLWKGWLEFNESFLESSGDSSWKS